MDEQALLHEVLVAPRRAFVPMPDTRVIERPGWMQLITPSLPEGGLNEVSLAVLAPGDVDAVVGETLAGYREVGVRFRWTLGPDSSPNDLAARLEARGLEPEIVWGVACPIEAIASPLPPGLVIEPVDTTNVHEFADVMARGWAMNPTPLLALHRRVLDVAPERIPMHLARLHGEPVAAAAVAILPRSAFLMGGVVLPEYRGRGFYRALVDSRLREAARRGCTLATSAARADTSHPILSRLGFRDVCRLTMLAPPHARSPTHEATS